MWERFTEGAAAAVVLDLLVNGAQFLSILADTLLTPVVLFAFTILPNVDTSTMPWIQDAFVGAVIVLGIIVLLSSIENAFEKVRSDDS